MTIRYLIAAALMASACAAHADVIPSSGVGVVNGSDALVQALYQKVSASVGSDMKVSLKQGIDGVYVTGLSTAKAAALAGDGMSVISTPDGYKIVDNSSVSGNSAVGGGANVSLPIASIPGPATNAGSPGGSNSGSAPGSNSGVGVGSGAAATNAGSPGGSNSGSAPGSNSGVGVGSGAGNMGNGNIGNIGSGGSQGEQAQDTANVPEPSTIALMLAGMLGVAGLGRRRSR